VIAAAGPTPFWYATRGSGYASLVLLSAVLVLGLVTSVRWLSERWPRFLTQSLHRNLSLLAVVFLGIHIAASIIDPFAGLSIRDAVVPVGANYRPLWLGLGVIAFELFLAVVVSSVLRRHLGWRTWLAIHLLAYASWPVAVLHSIGTGTDTKAVWALLLVIACVASVAVALIWRLSRGLPRQAAARVGGIAASLAGVVALTAWTATGPLQEGWARAAGTPASLLSGATQAAAQPTAPASPTASTLGLAAGLNDPLSGTVLRSGGTVTATLTDQSTPSLQIVIVSNPDGSAVLTITSGVSQVCNAPASLGRSVTAQCGSIVVGVQVFDQGGGSLTGTLVTQAR
jgi:sulfoxide reductase heme-binding subunit YedZ